jgi:hypothetical protein
MILPKAGQSGILINFSAETPAFGNTQIVGRRFKIFVKFRVYS